MAKRNKLRKACIEELSNDIKSLEQAHKLSVANKCLDDILITREELLEELQKTLKLKYALTHKLFYKFGHKIGKLLVRALQKRKTATTIRTIKTPSGASVTKTEDISLCEIFFQII